ncbi:MAG: MBOAT family protein, partial [Flavobacteriales bacterium]|nr:MBOAT family protein [Flavobacteriales bacterium]
PFPFYVLLIFDPTVSSTMLFNSPVFLFFFLPIVLLINRLLNNKISNVFLLLASLSFYFYGEKLGLGILLTSILWNYSFGLLIDLSDNSHSKRKLFLGIGILGNISILIYFKYAFFIADSFGLLGKTSFHFENIILPLGISFFSFQSISYLIDVFRQEVKAERSPLKVGLFISYFPQLIAGPIIKYKQIHEFIQFRKVETDDLREGLTRFIRGLAKKVILADNFAIVADKIFSQDVEQLSSPVAWLGVLCYTLQIYFDFSAYSDMAIALGRMMGFKIPENFNYPYAAKSVKEFWRKWHISLSSWFKDYLYIPLGGNRKSGLRTMLNLITVFFLTGLWHGASWNFVVWGLIHGLFLIIERYSTNWNINIPNYLRHAYLILFVSLSWVFFRTENLDHSLHYFERLFQFTGQGDNSVLIHLNPFFICILLVGLIFSSPMSSRIQQKISETITSPLAAMILRMSFNFVLLIYTLSELVSSNHQAFIYFKF